MFGSILGDIIGSDLEYKKPKLFDYRTTDLFSQNKFFTDDSVMYIATKYAIDNDLSFSQSYRMFGKMYPNAGYGCSFDRWIKNDNAVSYNSFGNGSAMRVGYIGEIFDKIEDVEKYAIKSAECTHNHIEGIKGAVTIAIITFLARHGYTKTELSDFTKNKFGYNVSVPLDSIRPRCNYDVTCQGSVPLAIRCFLESENYEDCIRNVLSLNCDVDTVACIAGGIAENFYGDTGFDNKALMKNYLDDFLLKSLFQ